jgi:hypothetical protein
MLYLLFSLQISQTEFGSVKTVELKPGGADIPVTNENRKGRLLDSPSSKEKPSSQGNPGSVGI